MGKIENKQILFSLIGIHCFIYTKMSMHCGSVSTIDFDRICIKYENNLSELFLFIFVLVKQTDVTGE